MSRGEELSSKVSDKSGRIEQCRAKRGGNF